MDLQNYQQLSQRTLINKPGRVLSNVEQMLSWNAIGLAGETGELCDIIKKTIYHGHALDIVKVSEEIGDVLWYLSAIATKLCLSLSDCAEININKLRERYPQGFSEVNSHERDSIRETTAAMGQFQQILISAFLMYDTETQLQKLKQIDLYPDAEAIDTEAFLLLLDHTNSWWRLWDIVQPTSGDLKLLNPFRTHSDLSKTVANLESESFRSGTHDPEEEEYDDNTTGARPGANS